MARYDGDVARRLLVKPGMTGLWQVSGRSDLSWEDGIRLDLYYVENWSLAADLTILWKTFGAVLNGRGRTDRAGHGCGPYQSRQTTTASSTRSPATNARRSPISDRTASSGAIGPVRRRNRSSAVSP